MNTKTTPRSILIGGIVALIIVMGIGRFAYTPILPLMQEEINFTSTFAGFLASSNYLGYLLGALVAGLCTWKKGKVFYLRIFLLINIFSTMMMGITNDDWGWMIIRFISGLTSGLVFVLASSIVLDVKKQSTSFIWSGLFYSGVGFGIFITGLIVPMLHPFFSWQGTWIGLGMLSLFMSIFSFLWLKASSPSCQKQVSTTEKKTISKHKKELLPWLIASYGCEGSGYIVSGTFLVALVQEIPSFNNPSLSWALVGAAAFPSCIVWNFIAKKFGNTLSLQIAFFTQIIGVMIPVILFNTYGTFIGAFLFGATFMGITTLSISEARNLSPNQSNHVIGSLTFVYGIGQIIGPLIAGKLISIFDYQLALIFAASVLVCGMVFLGIGQFKSSKMPITDTKIVKG